MGVKITVSTRDDKFFAGDVVVGTVHLNVTAVRSLWPPRLHVHPQLLVLTFCSSLDICSTLSRRAEVAEQKSLNRAQLPSVQLTGTCI